MNNHSSLLRNALLIALLFVGQSLFTSALASTRSSVMFNMLQQSGNYYVIIKGNNVIGRDGPAGTDAGYRFNKGDRLQYVKKDGSWYHCRVNGRNIWVSTSYASLNKRTNASGYSSASANGTVVITGDRVIARATPGGKDTGKRFYSGQRLPYYGSNGSWYRVSWKGAYYWVSSNYSYVK